MRASSSRAFSNSFCDTVTRCRSPFSLTSARTTSMPAMMPLCFRSCACRTASGRLELRARRLRARVGGKHLEVRVCRHQHDQVARALVRVACRLDVVGFGARFVGRAQIDERLR